MLKKISVIGFSALIVFGALGSIGCNRTNPLANKTGMENLIYMLQSERDESWPTACERYYVDTAALRYKQRKESCAEKSAAIYNKYKNHEALAGATLDDFRDSKVWELVQAKYPSRDFRT